MQSSIRYFFKRHSFLTNTLTGAGLFVAGDLLEQRIEMYRGLHEKVDGQRIGRIGLVGLLQGPPHILFYNLLDKYLPSKTFKTISKKILLDQLIACPMFSVLFFIPMSLLEGKSLKTSNDEFMKKFPFVYLIDWLLWPPCQVINFLFIPSHYRVLYVNAATVFWNVFLSYMKHFDQFS